MLIVNLLKKEGIMLERLSIPNTKSKLEVNEELLEKLKEWADEGIYEYEMAERLGITPQHFSRLKSQYPALKELDLKNRGEIVREDRATKVMWDMIEMRNKQSASLIMFYLKCKHGWTEKRTLEITSSNNSIPDISNLDPIEASKVYNEFMKNN